MHIVIVGVSHKTTPVAIREKIGFPESKLAHALGSLKSYPEIKEVVILSTCNRVEIYALVKEPENGINNIKQFICDYHQINPDDLENCLYFCSEIKAVEHLFRVVSSLESMIVGEPQIFGQIKDAYQAAFENKTTGIIFNTLFKNAISVGKSVRTDTDISKSAVSISFAAVELAKKIFNSIEGKTVMIIGAGKMSELTAKHLITNGVTKVVVANRTYEKACDMAKVFNGTPIRFEALMDNIVDIDIVISSTGAPHFIITKKDAQKIIHIRKNKPIFFIDIAVPRDIDPTVNEVDNIFLYDIDDLKEVVTTNIQERAKEIPKVEAIIAREQTNFETWYNSLSIVPTIVLLRDELEDIRLKEFDKTINKIKSLSESDKNLINAMSKAIVNKILHKPILRLKKASEEKNDSISSIVMELFDLKEKTISSSDEKVSEEDVGAGLAPAQIARTKD
ncbi:MAG: glutamyl-tRNA reductase [Candidatus Firestonebacteria bacterium]|nr:glutamyl-tRNA reductase [Candidatus Firestonebacteria bacterium]